MFENSVLTSSSSSSSSWPKRDKLDGKCKTVRNVLIYMDHVVLFEVTEILTREWWNKWKMKSKNYSIYTVHVVL